MAIHEVRYMPGPEDRAHTTWNGVRFRAGEWVELDSEKHRIEIPIPHKHTDRDGNEFTRTKLEMVPMVESAKTNPYFEVREKGGKVIASAADKKKSTHPTTAEEYQAYASKWINEGTDPDEMKVRWRREHAMREKVGAADAIAEEIYAVFSTKVEMLEMMGAA